MCVHAQVASVVSDSMDYCLPGSSVHGILQARILDWVAIPFSRGSSWLRDQPHVSCIAGRFLTVWATREAHLPHYFWSTGILILNNFIIVPLFQLNRI